MAEDIWKIVRDHLPQEKKQEVAQKIVDRFCDEDADADWEEQQVFKVGYPLGWPREDW